MYKKLPGIIADMLMPDYCAVCGASLFPSADTYISNFCLCNECLLKADNSVFNKKYPAIGRCSFCSYPLTSEDCLCSRCREKDWNFSSSEGIFLYEGIVKELISAYKFENRKNLSIYFALKVFETYIKKFTGYTIVPVPYRPASKRKRGWDQVQLICSVLEKKYSLPVCSCLYRNNGPAQKTMNFSQRLVNLQDKIGVRNCLIPDRALLLDDVFTTGATMDCCAGILQKAGCEDVRCIALAIDL